MFASNSSITNVSCFKGLWWLDATDIVICLFIQEDIKDKQFILHTDNKQIYKSRILSLDSNTLFLERIKCLDNEMITYITIQMIKDDTRLVLQKTKNSTSLIVPLYSAKSKGISTSSEIIITTNSILSTIFKKTILELQGMILSL